jgi:Concanavalin A-like lectin/glucanases superfamily
VSIDLRPYCVAQWKMNEVGGTLVADSSGNGNNGTSVNTIVGVTGKIGGAINFNGTSNYINTNSNFQSVFQNSFTISAWARPSALQMSAIVGFYSSGIDDPLLYMGDLNGRLEAEYKINSTTSFYKSSSPTNINSSPYTAWGYLIFRGTKISSSQASFGIFINGTQIGTEQTVNLNMGDLTLAGNILIGNDSISSPYLFSGGIDNICIFTKAISTDEIAFLYGGGKGTELLTDIITSTVNKKSLNSLKLLNGNFINGL